ncbi:anti-sigma factor [Mesorhizobium sp. Root157]|uniref:anti-sigma factor family protein n=1 Tax=Mesorhizobium sp. Root157 TaxID=1736477 RepID=UPI0006F4F406|nr:anti-sigma factor [Mesorhizobium sp. Root157]KQZ94253.1 anti-sigma factor [Mesorhizobium sp. Root157]
MTRRDFSERDIHLALDNELPGDERAGYEAWLEASPEMKARSARYVSDNRALRAAFADVLDEPVPARLHNVVIGEAARPTSASRSKWWLAAAAVLLLGLGGMGGYFAGAIGLGLEDGPAGRLAEEAIAAHVIYAAEKRHAVEVPASDRDHMQTWLSNRVGLKLVAPDLTDDGFELVGGRLLPAAGSSKAAMLLYEDAGGNRVSLFVTSESAPKTAGVYNEDEGGPTAVYWLDRGYGCAVVGSLPDGRLNEVAKRAYKQLVSGIWS